MTENEILMIKEMKEMQAMLDADIHAKHNSTYDLENTKRALIDEIGETNHEAKDLWCWWKFSQAPVNKANLLEELADTWHFALSIDNHENEGIILDCDVAKYNKFTMATLMAYAVIKVETIIPVMINITNKLGFSISDVYQAYKKKNIVNYERLKKGY